MPPPAELYRYRVSVLPTQSPQSFIILAVCCVSTVLVNKATIARLCDWTVSVSRRGSVQNLIHDLIKAEERPHPVTGSGKDEANLKQNLTTKKKIV